ncbi:hypothetical protein BKA93DRAFT_742478 [Sparassis latifolia]
MSTSYATDESPSQLWYEQSINAAVYIGAMAWGVHTSVFYTAVRCILQNQNQKRRFIWLPFVCAQFTMSTVNIICSINFNEHAWIDERNYPGGPLAFIVERQSLPVNTASIAASVVTIFLAQGFLIFRVHELWKKAYITLCLILVLLASTVMSVLHCIQASRTSSGLWDQSTLSLSVPFASLAMSLNILLSISLTWRLLDLRRQLPSVITDHLKETYTGFEALLVESALPYGIVSCIFVVLYGLQNAGANLCVPLLVQLEASHAARLVILRIVRGYAWSMDIVRRVGPANITFRGSLGRPVDFSGTDEVSLATLNLPSGHSSDAKVPSDLV